MILDRESKIICADCRKTMWAAIILYAFQDLVSEIIIMYAAKITGNFANSIMNGVAEVGNIELLKLCLCIVVIVVFVPLLETLGEITMFKKSLDYCNKMYSRFLGKQYASVMSIEEGVMQYRVENDVIDFYLAYTDIAIKVLTLPIAYTCLMSNVFGVNAILGSIVLFVGVISSIIKVITSKKSKFYISEKSKYSSQYRAKENELFAQGLQFVLWNIYPRWIKKLKEDYWVYYKNIEKKNTLLEVALTKSIKFSVYFGNILILLAGAMLASTRAISPGNVAEMLGYYNIFVLLNTKMIDLFSCLVSFNVYTDRMKFLYQDQEDEEKGKTIDYINKIELDKLCCGYEQFEVVRNLSFDHKGGKRIQILGDNGSGKSTLINHICRLLSPISGRIVVNGMDSNEISLSSYRKTIAYLPQNVYIFNVSVYENICFGMQNIQEERINKLAEKLGILSLLDREITNNGNELSGGERQKIGLARALIREASVLIIDEPENNLDYQTKECIREIINQYSGIVIFVSHDKEMNFGADEMISIL